MSKKQNIFVDEENNPAVSTYRVLQSMFQVVFHTRLKMHNQAKGYFLSTLHHFLWWHHTSTPTLLSCDLKKLLGIRSRNYFKTDEWIAAKEIRLKVCHPFPRWFHQLFALTPFSALFSCPPQGEEQCDHAMARCIHSVSIYSSWYKEIVQRALQSSAKQRCFKEATPNKIALLIFPTVII